MIERPRTYRRLVLVAFVAMLGIGCQTKRQALIATGFGVGLLALGGAAAWSNSNDRETEPPAVLIAGSLLVTGGIATIFGGVSAARLYEEEHEREAKRAAPVAPLTVQDPACVDERREIMRRAAALRAPEERGRVLRALPSCERVPR